MAGNIKISFIILFFFFARTLPAQTEKTFRVHQINLTDTLAHPENQFSGLTYRNHQLYLLCESRIQDKHIARIYTIHKTELNKAIADTTYQPKHETILILNLDQVKTQIDATGNHFEGLEAIDIKGKHAWLTIETVSPSQKGYLIKGKLKNNQLIVNPREILPLDIPLKNGAVLDNSGYESIAYRKGKLMAAFEYNYFDSSNHFLNFSKNLSIQGIRSIETGKIPFRITDWQFTAKNELVALNVFYKGKADSYFRVPPTDTLNYKYTVNDKGEPESFTRIIKLYKKQHQPEYRWTTLGLLPGDYGKGYNWEGITPFQKGYFITNDKFTPTKERKSYLLYIELP